MHRLGLGIIPLLLLASFGGCGDDPVVVPGCAEGTRRDCTTASSEAGEQTCTSGVWGTCVAKATGACKDGAKQSCTTTCGTGTEICVKGEWQNCDAPKPAQEVCDGVDNNCDGQVDEVCACVHGKMEACYSGATTTRNVGKCKDGQRVCDKGVWGACTGEVLPDSGEVCTDTIDNNCNGTVNEGCTCTPGQSQACGSATGVCKQGVQTCNAQAQWGTCTGATGPFAETCDGIDNDCDGVVDNNLPLDNGESNNDCPTARAYTISDSDTAATELDMTLYPQNDVDYFKITAKEDSIIIPPCAPGADQCNYLEVELVPPTVTGLQYQYSLLPDSCTSPSQAIPAATGKKTFSWKGTCWLDDSRDFWIKVEFAAGSNPTFSCNPYKLKLRYTRLNEKCP